MFRFFETIKLTDGVPQNLVYHHQRMHKTLLQFYGRNLLPLIENMIAVPQEYSSGIIKCRIEYNDTTFRMHYDHYTPKIIKTLKLIKSDIIDYSFKYTNRKELNDLLALRDDCDDILIVKNGMITDTSYTNIAFYDKSKWYTPSTPLLKGTMRERLIETGLITEKLIAFDNFREFDYYVLINSMLGFVPSNALSTSTIIE